MLTNAREEDETIPWNIITWSALGKQCTSQRGLLLISTHFSHSTDYKSGCVQIFSKATIHCSHRPNVFAGLSLATSLPGLFPWLFSVSVQRLRFHNDSQPRLQSGRFGWSVARV